MEFRQEQETLPNTGNEEKRQAELILQQAQDDGELKIT
jgi:hypothetical protein